MSEAVTNITEPDIMGEPHKRTQRSAEIIEFPGSAEERAIGTFIESLRVSIDNGSRSMELAAHIDSMLSADDTGEDPSETKQELRSLMARTDAFSQNEVYDHKDEHDPVFQRLVSTLQQTRGQQRSLHDQRRAALRLTELRAALPLDQTPSDDSWHLVIDRLFEQSR